ncbi:hypothetical protein ACWKTZ_20370 [Bacillus cereus]
MIQEEKIELVITESEENVFKVKTSTKGVRIDVTATRTSPTTFVLSGRGAKKFKKQITNTLLVEHAASEDLTNIKDSETQPSSTNNNSILLHIPTGNESIAIKENNVLGYDITIGSLTFKAEIKKGKANSDFGWEGYEVSGLDGLPKQTATMVKTKILDAIEEYRLEKDLHPLNILHEKEKPKDGDVVRVFSNMFLFKWRSNRRSINPLKDKYVGEEAKVVETQHTFLSDTIYRLEFLKSDIQDMNVQDNILQFHEKELIII